MTKVGSQHVFTRAILTHGIAVIEQAFVDVVTRPPVFHKSVSFGTSALIAADDVDAAMRTSAVIHLALINI